MTPRSGALETTVKLSRMTIDRLHIMTAEEKDMSLPEELDLTAYRVLDVTDAVLSVNGERLSGYEGLVEFSLDDASWWLLMTESGDGELWPLDEELMLTLDASRYEAEISGTSFRPSLLALKAEEGGTKVYWKMASSSEARISRRDDVTIRNYRRESIDTGSDIVVFKGELLSSAHSLIRETVDEEDFWYIDGKPVGSEPSVITGDMMIEEDFRSEFILRDGHLIPDITSMKSFRVEDRMYFRIKTASDDLILSESDVTRIEKSAFHQIPFREVVIFSRKGECLTDALRRLSTAEIGSGIWFMFESIGGSTRLFLNTDIDIIGDGTAEETDPGSRLIIRDGEVIQNIDRILTIKNDGETWIKLMRQNGLTEAFREGEREILTVESSEVLDSTGIRMTADGRAVWDIRRLEKVTADGRTFIVVTASAGKKLIWNEDDVGFTVNAADTVREALGARGLKLGFVDERSVLIPFLTGKDDADRAPVPIIFPFGTSPSETEAVRSALSSRISDITAESPEKRTRTILSIAANVLIRNGSVHLITDSEAVMEALDRKSLSFLAADLTTEHEKAMFLSGAFSEMPSLHSWKADREALISQAEKLSITIKEIEDLETESLSARSEIESLKTELEGLSSDIPADERRSIHASSSEIPALIDSIEAVLRDRGKLTGSFIRSMVKNKNGSKELWKRMPSDILALLPILQKERRILELRSRLTEIRNLLQQMRAETRAKEMETLSMKILRAYLAERYGEDGRDTFMENDLLEAPERVIREYPMVIEAPGKSSLSDRAFYTMTIIDAPIGSEAEKLRAMAPSESAVTIR